MNALASKKRNVVNLIENSFETNTKKHIIACIGYGSAVINQKGNVASMLDLILIVDNIEKFHYYNLSFNKSHYNLFSKIFGYKFPSKLNNISPSIYFNHSVMLKNQFNETQICKYGVVCIKTIKRDIIAGDNFFTLGRLQKPFVYNIFSINEDKEIMKIFENNRKNGFYIGVLCTNFSELKTKYTNYGCYRENLIKEILYNILNLSYIGDIRFYLKGEKKSKVRDMLDGSLDVYLNNFKEEFEELFSLDDNIGNTSFLLKIYCKKLAAEYITKIKLSNLFFKSNEDFINYLSNNSYETRLNTLQTYLKRINFKISFKAFVINTFTSKFNKGIQYLLKKIKKSFSF